MQKNQLTQFLVLEVNETILFINKSKITLKESGITKKLPIIQINIFSLPVWKHKHQHTSTHASCKYTHIQAHTLFLSFYAFLNYVSFLLSCLSSLISFFFLLWKKIIILLSGSAYLALQQLLTSYAVTALVSDFDDIQMKKYQPVFEDYTSVLIKYSIIKQVS